MPFISPDDGYLNVFNLFETETRDGQERVVDEMKKIVDNATYQGWVSSTVHAGLDSPGTLNCVQWRSPEDLEARYAGARFKNKTVPLFNDLATSVRLLKTEVTSTQHHPSLGGTIEISPDRDDYTVFVLFGVEPENQKELLETLTQPEEWLLDVPGYRSHACLRGIDGTFVVYYAQWEGKELYEAYHNLPEHERPADVQKRRSQSRSLLTSWWSNSFRAVHSRSAASAASAASAN
jgi:heme-degrading monooxygenase HmoA